MDPHRGNFVERQVNSTDNEMAQLDFDHVNALESQHVLQTYKRAPVAFVRGEGTRLFDSTGKRYLDFLSGIGVVVLGHGHPALAQAVADQAATLVQTSNLYFHPLQGQLAARLAALSGLQRTFFCNSGTEAVEACLKFARRYWYSKGDKGRTRYVALQHGFSGRTMGALSVTANANYRAPFEPLIPGVTFVPPDDPASLDAAVTSETAAIIAEPIQGEGGVRPLSQEFAAAIERVCERTGALLIADEVQCGLGRTGACLLLPRPWSHAGFDFGREGVGIGRSDRCRARIGSRRQPGVRRAITGAPTAAICCRLEPGWSCSSSSRAQPSHGRMNRRRG